jgi:integrase
VTVRLVITDAKGRPVNRRLFDDGAWRPALERAGVVPRRQPGARRPPSSPDDGMHVLRHTAASAWLRAGVDAGRVADWLGDTVKTVLAVYVHFLPGGGEGGRDAVEAFFAQADGSAGGASTEAR